jgi:hypothetical protein
MAAVSKALSDAVKMGTLASNPALGLERPAASEDPRKAWTGEETGRFLNAELGSDFFPIWRFMLSTGVRPARANTVPHQPDDSGVTKS